MRLDELKADLAYQQKQLAKAHEAEDSAEKQRLAARELGGGIPGFGGSGNQRAARTVRAASLRAYEAEKKAAEWIESLEYKIQSLERRIGELERVRFTAADLATAKYIKTATGWREVVKVNAKSVTVESGYSWTDRVAIEKVREWR